MSWLITSLIRLRACPNAFVPVTSNRPFKSALKSESNLRYWPIEITSPILKIIPDAADVISKIDIDWMQAHLINTINLIDNSDIFNMLHQALDQCRFIRHMGLALLSLWSALESIFSPSKSELRYRISTSIASYLEPPGHGRMVLQKRITKLYDARSSVAHGRIDDINEPLESTYSLARRIVTKIIETNRVPNRNELEAKIFVVED